jgi:3-dehydroquinate dehydratase II
MMRTYASARGCILDIFYTHVEGEAIGRVYEAADQDVDGLLINPAGFLHAGYALRDCLRSFKPPIVEVHMSNIDKRGLHSVTAGAAHGVIAGFGTRSYLLGLDALADLIESRNPDCGRGAPSVRATGRVSHMRFRGDDMQTKPLIPALPLG